MCTKYEDNDIHVRDANREDMAAVAEMIQELADFEKMSDGPKLSIADLQKDGFDSTPPAFCCKVAELNESARKPGQPFIVGFTLYFPIYSTWEGRAILMEDLYVRASERGKGVGGRLFDAVANTAVKNGGSRVDFHVLGWNPACEFYSRRGARDLSKEEDWKMYRLTDKALKDNALRHDKH